MHARRVISHTKYALGLAYADDLLAIVSSFELVRKKKKKIKLLTVPSVFENVRIKAEIEMFESLTERDG